MMYSQVDLLRPFDAKLWPKELPLSIYGTGYAARIIRLLLAEQGIQVRRFLDYDRDGQLDGLAVTRLDETTGPVVPQDETILVASGAWIRPANRLRTLGYSALYDGYSGLYQERSFDGMESEARGALALISHAVIKQYELDAQAAADAVIRDFREHGPYAPHASQLSVSMMPHDVHAVVQMLVRLFPGPTLEIGTYVGGLTVTIARGLAGTGYKQILVERGGSTYVDESLIHAPTDDILRDLKHNLAVLAPDSNYILVDEAAQSAAAARRVSDATAGERIGILVMDADGDVRRTLDLYEHLLHPNCILIMDDFVDSYPDPLRNKGRRTRDLIYDMVGAGIWQEIGVCRGTWFGRQCLRSA